jgi:ATP-dependent RNA helicase UAP56/SUB2
MKQEQRIERFTAFKAFKYRVLVATDLFGRGVDIEKINVVINYDFTDDPDQYLHRVGRAGRFGTKGLAISFIAPPVTGKDGEEVQNDQKVLDIVQSRFSCQVPPLPNSIDAASYQSAYK